MSELLIHSTPLHGNGLQASFRRDGDLFSHALRLVLGADKITLLSAIKERGPVFQELHRQDDSAVGLVLFATGMADARYWAGTVTTFDENGQSGLAFDIASRSKTACAPPTIAYAAPEEISKHVEPTRIRLMPQSGPACVLEPLAISGEPCCRFGVQSDAILIQAQGEGSSHRFGFRLWVDHC